MPAFQSHQVSGESRRGRWRIHQVSGLAVGKEGEKVINHSLISLIYIPLSLYLCLKLIYYCHFSVFLGGFWFFFDTHLFKSENLKNKVDFWGTGEEHNGILGVEL